MAITKLANKIEIEKMKNYFTPEVNHHDSRHCIKCGRDFGTPHNGTIPLCEGCKSGKFWANYLSDTVDIAHIGKFCLHGLGKPQKDGSVQWIEFRLMLIPDDQVFLKARDMFPAEVDSFMGIDLKYLEGVEGSVQGMIDCYKDGNFCNTCFLVLGDPRCDHKTQAWNAPLLPELLKMGNSASFRGNVEDLPERILTFPVDRLDAKS